MLIIMLIIFLIIISIIISILLSISLTPLSISLETVPPVDNHIEITSEICITVTAFDVRKASDRSPWNLLADDSILKPYNKGNGLL